MGNDGRDWMYYPRRLPEFEAGVNKFLDASFAKGVLTKNATKPNSATTSISSGSRRQLIDEDDEDEDDLRYQDLNERDRKEVGYEDDENEDIEDDLRL
ncbi:hypothetical protein Tco_0856346 [Tanacetum coccineum]|uniref:Uncharacterized protein n=1 Tax=Tanacetum coccineum TaxID=301880 RepID=A0ABQ5B4W2_9ASTR